MFNESQKDALRAPLNRIHVSTRKQAGRSVSYIEGWHAIAEANYIFGFDAWSRESVEIKMVSEREREVGQQKKPGWGVTYTARVRVTVGDVVREGCGAGHGIDQDLGQAHESAIKEAETDAMKRALITFGNPFGLALYDKSQENVETVDPATEKAKEIEAALKGAKTLVELAEVFKTNEPHIRALGDATKKVLTDLKDELKAELGAKEPDPFTEGKAA